MRQGLQASVWGLTVRKDAVWAEGLADGAPWVRPGHHEAASCGLRRCRELRVNDLDGLVVGFPVSMRRAISENCSTLHIKVCRFGG